jgi:putative sporulation protein YyaC
MKQDIIDAIRYGVAVDILCLGNPAIPGDSIGPLVGELLKRKTHPFKNEPRVIGCREIPVVRKNYHKSIESLRKDAIIIVVDACVSDDLREQPPYWGRYMEPIVPGAFLDDSLDPIGHITYKCFTGYSLQCLIDFRRSKARQMSSEIYYSLMDLFIA